MVVDEGREHGGHRVVLGVEIEHDVLVPTRRKVEVIGAYNYSYQIFRDRKVLMYYEKERKKLQRQMGQDPYLDTPG